MSSICLLDFPVEIFHRIFDYLDTRTIIRSLRCVCRQLNGIVSIYNRYEIDLTLFTKVQCEFILQSIRCENIISLIFSADFKEQSDKTDYLLTILNIQQFPCLRSLTLLHVNKNELDRFLPYMINLPLISLSIQLSGPFQTASLSSLSTAITQWKLRKLHIFNGYNLIQILPWPVDCNLNHLTITSCTDQEYRSILEHSPFLRTFVMEYCLVINTIPSVKSTYLQLTSLVMNYSSLSFGQLNYLLSLTPSLVHLKLINHTDHFSSLFDGNRWEELIQSKLRLLKNFQFCFRHTIRKLCSTFCTNLHSIIQQYRTPFWLDIKRWFVIADCIMRSSSCEIILYTIPITIGDFNILIRCKAFPINDLCYFTKNFSNENNPDIQEDKTIVTLNLNINSIEQEGLQYLIDALENNTTITTLTMDGNQIGAQGVQHLAESLQNNTTIMTLSVRGNQIGDEGARHLSYGLRNNRTLTTLRISRNQFGDEGLQHLTNALQHNTTLTIFDYEDNHISNDGIQHLCDVLRKDTSLHTLELGSNQIDVSKVQHLANMLEDNMTLTTLSMRDNELSSNGTEYLANALQKNTTLRILNLRLNHIDDNGAEYLANALMTNTTLTTLYLWNNQIRSTGARCLADALQNNTTVITLDLGRNQIGTAGTKYLADMLRINSTLTTLSLWDNEIKVKGAEYLAAALKTNKTLTTLDMGFNQIGDNGEQYLLDTLHTHKTLITLNLGNNPLIFT
ncbi:unnamed protein product [Adineta steineri]|uniref:F-box domain-containing protein n=1 Tax=Adineta steineri TaxID=433720 RepID=A0A815KD92_9BILA|nr:unnamed protein product [Adineta steineri]